MYKTLLLILAFTQLNFCEINVLYEDQEKTAVNTFIELVQEIPEELTASAETVVFNKENFINSGIAYSGETIELFALSEKNIEEQKFVITHELAHCWAFDNLGNDYAEYIECVKKDNTFIREYSANRIINNGCYAEDFADAVGYYFTNDSFEETFPSRSDYIRKCFEKGDKNE